MAKHPDGYDVVIDFWEWYQRRNARYANPIAEYALDKCEEMLMHCQWEGFGYWHSVAKCQTLGASRTLTTIEFSPVVSIATAASWQHHIVRGVRTSKDGLEGGASFGQCGREFGLPNAHDDTPDCRP